MLKKITLVFICMAGLLTSWAQDEMPLNHLASYETGGEGSAEVVTYDVDSKRAFFTSSENNSFSIIDLSDPKKPTLIKEVSLADFGGGPNSIAVKDGVVALAIENENKQENGKVVLFDVDGEKTAEYEAGALPDMLTFSPYTNHILVANEGEPSDDYMVDPKGSITVIDLDAKTAVTNTFDEFVLDFQSTDLSALDFVVSWQNSGVRFAYGDYTDNWDSEVEEGIEFNRDLEPEYIAVTADTLAYINCQENNAFIIFDYLNNKVVDVKPLGYKDHLSGTPSIQNFNINELVAEWPELGVPVYDGGQDAVNLGGFSGLFFAADESSEEEYVFYTIPDRGPNASPVKKAKATPASSQNLRPFKLPNYQARIVKFVMNPKTGAVALEPMIMLTRKDGTTPISGRGNIPGFDEVPVTYTDAATDYKNVDFTDDKGETYHQLPYDEYGGDFEGILKDKDGNFWMCDEYRPAIYKFDGTGKLIERYVPEGTSKLGDEEKPAGTYGAETLPAIYNKRRANRGFEGISYDDSLNIVYAFIQTPLYNPSSVTKNKSDAIRILGISAETGEPVAEYLYLLEANTHPGYGVSRVDKIGDVVFKGNNKMLVIERDSDKTSRFGKKYIFEIDLTAATNLIDTEISKNDGSDTTAFTLENAPLVALFTNSDIFPVLKRKVLNLPSIGYTPSDKAEGIAILPEGKLAVMNDNDFGLAGAGITDNSVLGIISFADDYAFDASNKDDKINIQSHPTLGMYQPDGIASYEVDGVNYIVTANEGDSRDYEGYSEETRVKKLDLNPDVFPNAEELQKDENLGRLKVSTGNASIEGEKIDFLYSYGARSFSIFDEYGNLVYDSANEFAQKTAEIEPDLFNEDDGELDGRSDDKGVEPEAVEIGKIGDRYYAFIGLERQSSIMVYDITDPFSPKYITYYTNRKIVDGKPSGDISPEIIKFIPAADSPNNENLLLVGYEVSGSMGVVQLGGEITSISKEVEQAKFKLFPNPVSSSPVVRFDKAISGVVYSMGGREVARLKDQKILDVSSFDAGTYIVKSNLGTLRFMKL